MLNIYDINLDLNGSQRRSLKTEVMSHAVVSLVFRHHNVHKFVLRTLIILWHFTYSIVMFEFTSRKGD